MLFTADYHTHTRYSHGRGTIADNAAAARAAGLSAVAITDHGPASIIVGLRGERVLEAMRFEAAACSGPGLEVLIGAEANIVTYEGDLDLTAAQLGRLDIVICGLHPATRWKSEPSTRRLEIMYVPRWGPRKRRAIEKNTQAVLLALRRHRVDILAHPGLYFPVDIAEVARECASRGTLFEISSRHRRPRADDLRIAARTDVRFVLSSDAHRPRDVGRLLRALDLAREAGIDWDRIANIGRYGWRVGRHRRSGRMGAGSRISRDE